MNLPKNPSLDHFALVWLKKPGFPVLRNLVFPLSKPKHGQIESINSFHAPSAGSNGLNGVYCEGGPRFAESLLEEGLADYLFRYQSPREFLGPRSVSSPIWKKLRLRDPIELELGPDRTGTRIFMTQTIYLASGNAHKLHELQTALDQAGLSVQVIRARQDRRDA